jgi:5-methylcytosine-specific restriction protein A
LGTDILLTKLPGQNWTPQQSGIEIKDNLLSEFILIWEEFLNTRSENENTKNKLFEGNVQQKLFTVYERNSKARIECINHYGYKCQICFNTMEEIYGEIGRNFIHVHHIDFIFKIYGLIPRRSAAVKAVEKRSEKL